MERKIVQTGDGSTTIQLVAWDEQYHSMHGAVQEAKHVFLKMGMDFFTEKYPDQDAVRILEIGFGTGLNTLLTAYHTFKQNLKVYYQGIEAYPVAANEVSQLNYENIIDKSEFRDFFSQMHLCSWEKKHQLLPHFNLKKRKQNFEELQDDHQHDLIYFDAFGARVQPELWTETIFQKMHQALKKNGVLVTYSAKGSVRRAMQEVGFTVERLPGPPGKREMLRAVKNL